MAKREPNVTEYTPAGHKVEFFDSVGVDGEPQQRRYLIDGERLPSVTTITGILDKSRALIPWAVKLAEQGKDWRTERDEAADRGVAAHDLIVRMMAEGRQGRLSELDEEHRPWGQAAALWLLERNPRLLHAEFMLVGDGFAGRADLLCELDAKTTLVDFKTLTKRPDRYKDGEVVGLYPPYTENALQLSAYASACEYSGYPIPDELAVVRLFPDGSYSETPVPYKPENFLAVRDAYRAKLETDRDLRAA